ncbi:sugar isomerase, KpsF/GutQ [Akanthomyces lecanii RCEF 1005]|uniref:Sugar isomerase, KpsF/GutQ n=1 Tax=Akanthomyces lecanii RCEF 1005 TaxID=1081108 RepID=A0A168H2Q5_CORDF|nr:sugar isomerase, KpsF/GutQ [Akanthomyces lecanii RCEF 1005]
MGETRKVEHRPIQTSAVIVLNGSQRPITRPPSPPTPSVIPADSTVPCQEPPEAFQLAGQHNQYRPNTPYTASQSPQNSGQYVPPEDERKKEVRLRDGLHVMNTEALALANLAQLYETDAFARNGFHKAVEAITRQAVTKSKLVIIGVGKSGLIGKKLVATFQSLAVRTVFLHPTEALHGDLGIVGPDDTLLFITYSGSTQELLAVLPHLDESLPTILMTSHTRPDACEFIKRRPSTILLPAPVHEPERTSFGVSAPTTSTTAALALGDALAMTAAHELHPDLAGAFAKNHPGGAIGVAAAAASASAKKIFVRPPQTVTLRQIAIGWDNVHDASHLRADSPAASLLRAGYASKYGWVRVGEDVACPSQLRGLREDQLLQPLGVLRGGGLLVSCHDLLAMSAETTVRQARDILRGTTRSDSDDEGGVAGDVVVASSSNLAGLGDDSPPGASVIAVTENGRICGVLEVAQVLEHQE